jgi:PIN domain nuclease of toxin-antitoxin system
VRVVADSHAIVWYVQGSKRLSERASEVLAEAEAERSLVVSVATLIDLWYVSQTTRSVTTDQLGALRERLGSSGAVSLEPVTVAVADAATTIPRASVADPWDRLIMATAIALQVPLVTRDSAVRASGLVQTIW